MKRLIHAAAAAVLVCSPAFANLLTNGSFENTNNTFSSQLNDGGMSLPNASTTLPGWTVFSPGQNPVANIAWVFNTNNYGLATTFGSYFLDLTGYSDQAPYAGVQQTIATTSGASYTLTYSLMEVSGSNLYSGPVGATASADATSATCGSFNPGGSGNMSEGCTLNFTATGATTLISLQGFQGNEYIGVDNADVEAVTVGGPTNLAPEPAMALPVLASLGLLFVWKRPKAAR